MSRLEDQDRLFDPYEQPRRPDFDSRPRARTTDPETSHAAADSVTDLTRKQEAVLLLLREIGPTHDQRLVSAYQHTAGKRAFPYQSESGIRTRRAELVRKGLVRDTGERATLESGRSAIVWSAQGRNEQNGLQDQ